MRRLTLLSVRPFTRLFVAIFAIPLAGAVAACSPANESTSTVVPARRVAAETAVEVATEKRVASVDSIEVAVADVLITGGNSFEDVVDVVSAPPAEVDLIDVEALFHDGDDVVDYVAQAQLSLEEGRSGEAIVQLRHALFDDASTETWVRLGTAYLQSGDALHAMRIFEEVVRLDARQTDARKQLVRLNLDSGQSRVARTHADALVRYAPNDVSARYLAGLAYLKNEMWRQAIGEMEAVTAEEPTNIYAHNNAGFAAIQVGDVQAALVHLEPIAQLADAHAYMLNNLGVAYERSGREAEAHAAFSRAVELRPTYVNGIINKDRIEVGLSDVAKEISAEVLISLRTPATAGARERVAQDERADEVENDANAPRD